jgi:hypothetical protein
MQVQVRTVWMRIVTSIVCRFLSGSLLFWLQDFNCCGIVGVS